MPKKLSDSEQVADPVRARLESSASRIAALAEKAAAPARRPELVPVSPEPSRAPRIETPPPVEGPERVREHKSPGSESASEAKPEAPKKRLKLELHSEALTVDRKARFTASEAEANSELVRLMRRVTGTKPSEAAITRVLWALLREAEGGLKHEARRGVTLRRPPNGPSIEMAAYERDLGRILLSALKSLEL